MSIRRKALPLRAAFPSRDKFYTLSTGKLVLCLALAAWAHFGFFTLLEKLGINPFAPRVMDMELMSPQPLEIVLELQGLPDPLPAPEEEFIVPDDAEISEEPEPHVQPEPQDDLMSFPLSPTAALSPNDPTATDNTPKGPDNTINVEESAPTAKSYDISIRTAVARHWILPPEARNNFQPARFTASMTLDPWGQIIIIMVEESSGNPVLDHAAMEALRGAAPYEPFPPQLADLSQMTFRIHFDYRAVVKRSLPDRR
jgi:TonB family protein